MDKLSLILSTVMLLLMVLFMAPNIFALNRGHILRNVALWLAIMLGIALCYRLFGPAQHAHLPLNLGSGTGETPAESIPSTAEPAPDQNYTPPKE